MAVTTTKTNKPINPRGNDQSPKGYNRAALYSGKALDFDGVNDKITIDTDDIDLQEFSVVQYVNLGATAASKIFYSNYAPTGNVGFATGISDSTANVPKFYTKGTSSDTLFGSFALNVGEWYQIVATYDGATKKLYVNGVLDTQIAFSDTIVYTGATNQIGALSPSIAQPLDGQLSNVKVYSTALTATQVYDLYNNPEKIVPTGVSNDALKLWLPMMEGAGTTAYDGSGNGNHGTISGATWTHGIGSPVAQTAVIDWNKGTNLLPYSERFGQWTQNDSSVSDNIESAPNGSTTADKWVIDSGENSTADIRQTISSSIGQNYLLFVFAKADEFSLFQLDTSNSQFSDVNVDFDLSTGSIVSSGGDNITEGIIDKGNGWYLCYMVGEAIAGSGSFIIRNDATQTGNGSKGMYLWGAGYVQASDITSYIPTIDATAQTSDVLLPQGLTSGRDITGVNLFENVRKQGALNLDGNSWAEVHDNASLDFGTGSFTLEAWARAKYVSQGSSLNAIMTLGGAQNGAGSIGIISSGGIRPITYYNADGTTSTGAQTEGDWFHIVGVYDGTNMSIYINGAFDNSNARTAADITNAVAKYIGRDTTAVRYYNDQIAQPRIYNRALTAEEVQRNYDAGKNIYTNS